jgi:predicted TIM-barrel fold metal-dependent hydrolase
MLNRSWLASATETAIEPELEIVDAHHHLWPTSSRYGRYDLDDLLIDTGAGHNIVQTVFIDCGAEYLSDGPRHLRPVGETRFVAERADRSEREPGASIAAIVSHADLTLGEAVGDVLDHHVELAGGRFRGVRHSGARDDDPAVPTSRQVPPADLYRQADFQSGATTLAGRGLSFEAWQYHPQLPMVVDLARAVPELTIVVNHIGGPIGVGRYATERERVLSEVRAGLAELARLDNVVLKVGGIGMTRFGARWHADPAPPTSDQLLDLWGDTLRWCIDAFGPSRCLFESNYPVDGETASYVALWNAFKKVSAGYEAHERADLFAGTARRVYRLAAP